MGEDYCISPSQVRQSTKRNSVETHDTLAESCSVRLLNYAPMECSKVRNLFGQHELCAYDFGGMMSMKIANAEA